MSESDDRAKYYDQYWRDERVTDSPHQRWKIRTLEEVLSGATYRSIVDVGAGDGVLLARVARREARRVGVDLADDAVGKLRAKGLEGVQADLERQPLPFADETFDVAMCLDVLEHVFAPERLLDEIVRVTARGGTVILAVPNAFNLMNRVHYVLGRHVDVMDVAHRTAATFSEHIRFFSEPVLVGLAERAGLHTIERRYYFPDELSDLPAMSWAAQLVTRPRLHERLPSLFALGFLLVCRRSAPR